jgi:arylformamidase
MRSSQWIDVSVLLRPGMVHWPGDPPVSIKRIADMGKGDEATVSHMSMTAHTGTHMDAPLHFLAESRGIDEMDPSATLGPARVIEIDDPVSIRAEELESHDISAGERLLFKTRNSSHVWTEDSFVEDFVYISTDAARYLAERGVLAVGVDYLSVGGFGRDDIGETHRLLLAGGVWIIEGLDLRSVEAGDYELVCLPLRIERSDGAPARAVLRPLP